MRPPFASMPDRAVLLIAAMMLVAGAPERAAAQGRIESFFNNATNFLERQGRAIERELNQGSGASASRASSSRKAPADPPMPLPNPKRSTRTAAAMPKEAAKEEKEEPVAEAPVRRASPPERKAEEQPSPPRREELASAPTDHDAVPLPERSPVTDKTGADRKPEKPKRPPHPSEIASADWTEAEKKGGRSACTKMLASIVATYEPVEAIREGVCGAPAPIRLSAINSTPRVEIRPPALVTCAMAVQLANWMRDSVQPAAKKHLGEQVVAVRNVASYSCRNRYNAPGKRISEHAFVNALDIAAFETASGKTVTLLGHWHAKEPQQVSEPHARKAKDEADGEAAEAAREEKRKPRASPAAAKRLISAAEAATSESPPAPDPKPEKPVAPELVPAPEADFLHAAFDGACRAFGTVLGPEANAAHRDHFHLDMKERSYGGFCE